MASQENRLGPVAVYLDQNLIVSTLNAFELGRKYREVGYLDAMIIDLHCLADHDLSAVVHRILKVELQIGADWQV